MGSGFLISADGQIVTNHHLIKDAGRWVYIDNGECRLVSRNLKNLRFESLHMALGKLLVNSAIIDGEIMHCLPVSNSPDSKHICQLLGLKSPDRTMACGFVPACSVPKKVKLVLKTRKVLLVWS